MGVSITFAYKGQCHHKARIDHCWIESFDLTTFSLPKPTSPSNGPTNDGWRWAALFAEKEMIEMNKLKANKLKANLLRYKRTMFSTEALTLWKQLIDQSRCLTLVSNSTFRSITVMKVRRNPWMRIVVWIKSSNWISQSEWNDPKLVWIEVAIQDKPIANGEPTLLNSFQVFAFELSLKCGLF